MAEDKNLFAASPRIESSLRLGKSHWQKLALDFYREIGCKVEKTPFGYKIKKELKKMATNDDLDCPICSNPLIPKEQHFCPKFVDPKDWIMLMPVDDESQKKSVLEILAEAGCQTDPV